LYAHERPILPLRPRGRHSNHFRLYGRLRADPAYLLKVADDAVAEHLFSALARHVVVPAQATRWLYSASGDPEGIMAVAFPYFADAYRPPRIAWADGDLTYQDLHGAQRRVLNPRDFWRMQALAGLLDNTDGIEYFIRDGVLIAYDAAAGLGVGSLTHASAGQPFAVSMLKVAREHNPEEGEALGDALLTLCADDEVPVAAERAFTTVPHPDLPSLAPLIGRRVRLAQQLVLAELDQGRPPDVAFLEQVAADRAAAVAWFTRRWERRQTGL
jgi:hypothetical protein